MVEVEITYIVDYVQMILSRPISINSQITWGMFLGFVALLLFIAWVSGQK